MRQSKLLTVGLLAVLGTGLAAQTPPPGYAAVAPARVEQPSPDPTPPLVAQPPAVAAPPEPSDALFPPMPAGGGGESQPLATRSTLTGDWWGARTRLEDRGIKFDGNITQFGFGLDGGVNRALPFPGFPLRPDNGLAYTGRGDYALTFDLEKFGSPLPKGQLLVRAQHWYGQYANISFNVGSLPPAVFPAALPTAPNDPGVPFITDFVLTQPLSPNWVLFAGKKNVVGAADQDDFAGGNGTEQFVNQAFIANPAFLLGLPYSSFTAGVVSPRKWGAVSAFVYDPQDRTKDFFRVDDLFSQGVIVGGEVKVKTNFFSLPGEQHVGGMWKHVELTDLRFNEPPPGQYPYTAVPGFATLNNSYTLYYGFDQYLQVYSADSKRGWGLFGRASISDGNPTPLRYFLSAGLGGYSPLAYRRGDKFGVGWYYVGASNQFGPLPRALFGPVDGWGVELYYNVQVTPWMNLTPDFQIIRPNARAIADTAYIAGVRLNFKF